MIQFVVHGEPIAKGRPRFVTVYTKKGPVPKAITDDRTKAGEAMFLSAFQNAYPGFEPITTPIKVHMEFHSQKGHTNPAGRIDIDNAVKLVLDALNEKAFVDDWQVQEIHAFMIRSCPPGEECTFVIIEEIE